MGLKLDFLHSTGIVLCLSKLQDMTFDYYNYFDNESKMYRHEPRHLGLASISHDFVLPPLKE